MKKLIVLAGAILLFGLVTNAAIAARKGENRLPAEITNGPDVLGRETKMNGRQS